MSDKISYKSNRQVSYSCKYHIVFCPKYRRKVLMDGVDILLKEIINPVATELACEGMELEGMPDPVHLLGEVDPQFGVHKIVRRVKGRSSGWLRHEFPQLKRKLPILWTNSYFVSTVGGAPMAILKPYIETQKNF